MKPGRELDALIAEKVMGFSEVAVFDGQVLMREPSSTWEPRSTWYDLPHYSTDIAAANDVKWRLFETKAVWLLGRPSKNGFEVFPDVQGTPDWYVSGESEPHAICLAALKAVEA